MVFGIQTVICEWFSIYFLRQIIIIFLDDPCRTNWRARHKSYFSRILKPCMPQSESRESESKPRSPFILKSKSGKNFFYYLKSINATGNLIYTFVISKVLYKKKKKQLKRFAAPGTGYP